MARVVRGLSALFWGLPLALVMSVQVVASSWLSVMGFLGGLAPVLALGLLLYGTCLLGAIHREDAEWVHALDRTRLLALVNLGLSPFLHWHQRMPDVPLFGLASGLLAVSFLFFILNLNQVLRRLAALLPDEALQAEAGLFTTLNGALLLSLPLLLVAFLGLARSVRLPAYAAVVARIIGGLQIWLLLLLGLIPVAITMSLLWKSKEVLLTTSLGNREPAGTQ